MSLCAQRRAFRAFQRLPRHYYTAEAIRFGSLCPNNLEAQTITQKDGTSLSVMHVNGVSDDDPLPCADEVSTSI